VPSEPSTELACLDGRLTPASEAMIPATDEGFLRGDGAFELIRVYDGKPFALVDHLDRLEGSASRLRLPAFERTTLAGEIDSVLAERGGPDFDGCLRLVVTREGRRLLLTEQTPGRAGAIRLGAVTYAPTRVLDGIKSLSYGANMLCSRLARERGFDEALMVTPHGRVLEAPTSSLFWVDPTGSLCTPPLADHILASITRDRILRLVEVEERACTLDDLAFAEEAFLASTTREVQPVSAIEETALPDPGPLTRSTAAALREQITAELASP